MAKRTRVRAGRRDRRKAKQSGFTREATANPRKKGHHLYESPAADPLPEEAGGKPPSPSARGRCADGTTIHDFTPAPALGVKTCRFCGTQRKMAERDFSRKTGGRLSVPKKLKEKVAPAESPPKGPPSAKKPTPCRDHDFRYDADLGIYQCRYCEAVTK